MNYLQDFRALDVQRETQGHFWDVRQIDDAAGQRSRVLSGPDFWIQRARCVSLKKPAG